eukprot:gnl/TRDRNA2_/TRDRNA2_176632_c5_seq7.p1 gnl/TRDRNA2_/TRDRNA2_176632_c5~~gnl/TRDRNA2_/TRDRNA2_176632_c5_seq7.p1  ORF type:complete len:111 (+),score=2.28 gnl/TRDRNA2_/TRDRNA2_176632_c5_seq7:91-423(+)
MEPVTEKIEPLTVVARTSILEIHVISHSHSSACQKYLPACFLAFLLSSIFHLSPSSAPPLPPPSVHLDALLPANRVVRKVLPLLANASNCKLRVVVFHGRGDDDELRTKY